MAGSHVIVRTKDGELPDRTFEEAGRLAAWYSKGHSAPKVEIDYIQKKHVKKPAGAKPGFVVYYTNYSLMASPDISVSEGGYGVITIQQKTFLCSRISSRPDTCISASICPEKFFCKHRKFFLLNIRTPLRYMLTNKNRKTILFRSPSFFFTAGAIDVSAL